MADHSDQRFPLPPRKDSDEPKRKKRRSRPLHQRALRAVTTAPGKLMQRVNQELYRRNAELAARNKTLALLRQLDEISLAALDMRQIAGHMTEAIAAALGYDLATIAIVENQGSTLQWLAVASSVPWIASTLRSLDVKTLLLPLRDGFVPVQVVAKQNTQYAASPEKVYPPELVERLAAADPTAAVEEVKHTVLFPLRFGNQVLGVLTLSASRPFQQASQFEQESVTGIVGLVSLAMYKAKIYQDLETTTQQLEAANEQLKDLDKAKSEFLSIASHQLYTPLTALRGYLSMLREGDFGPLADKQAPILDILDKSANRLITLIKNLLDISRIEAGRLELKLESINLVEVAKQLVQELMPNALAKNLTLEFHPPSQAVPNVVADRDRIRQVLLNFIDNAIKYTPQGRIEVQLSHVADSVMCSVRDTGKGLQPAEIEKLFTKFTRVGGADRFHTEGTGLGLYVARQIVREHHGEVKAESPGVGQGSTFSMLLPAEGTPQSLKVGEQASVEIKAAETDSHDHSVR